MLLKRCLFKRLFSHPPALFTPFKAFATSTTTPAKAETTTLEEKPLEEEKEPTFLDMVNEYFDEAASFTNIRPDILNIIKGADCLLKVMIPLDRDNGSI